ncbi:MAG TPA: radical SAM family heme chaperone HemW, partial [Trueperaceae bacterium]|nr:radical SAM family heme chaperone HemW [Trueperaceae bacterium]
ALRPTSCCMASSYPDAVVQALYLHVPFCPSVCPYCDFHKMLRHEGLVARYLDRLEEEIHENALQYPGPLRTVYLGGGTPSHLRDAELTRLLAAIDAAWGRDGREETTLEADPLTFDEDRLEVFAALGVDRLSLGLQSTQDDTLRYLGRLHDGAQGVEAVGMALASTMRVNVDVMTSMQEQDLERDLRTVAETGARHISVYGLTIEENTPFARRGYRVDEDRDAAAFELSDQVLAEYGLQRYEVSNFAANGEESLHNLGYWRGAFHLGLGPSATAYLPAHGPFGARIKQQPLKGWLLGAAPDVDVLDVDSYLLERLLTGLRTREGVDLAALRDKTGVALESTAGRWLDDTIKHDLLTLAGGRLTATPTGLQRLDAVMRAYVGSRRLMVTAGG